MKRTLLVVLLATVFAGCAKRDYDGLCKLSTEILAEPRVKPSMRSDRFFADAPNVAFGSSRRKVIEALHVMNPPQRYELLLQAAREDGLEGWSCPAMESVLNPPVETSN